MKNSKKLKLGTILELMGISFPIRIGKAKTIQNGKIVEETDSEIVDLRKANSIKNGVAFFDNEDYTIEFKISNSVKFEEE